MTEVEQPSPNWTRHAKRFVHVTGGFFALIFLFVVIRFASGDPDVDALRTSFAKTKMPKSAQKQAQKVVNCISSNPLYWEAISPFVGRFRIPASRLDGISAPSAICGG